MDIGKLRRLHNLRRVRIHIKARDVLRRRAVEQLNVLRQIADELARLVNIALVMGGAIKAHRAARNRHDAHKRPRQSGFAGPRWPDHANALARLNRKGDAMQHRLFRARHLHDQIFNFQFPGGGRKLHAVGNRGNRRQDISQPLDRLAEAEELLPACNRLFDGRQAPGP